MIGRMAAFAGTGALNGLRGCAGVAKAGDEDGIGFALVAARFLGAKKGAVGGFVRRAAAPLSFSGLFCGVFCLFFEGLCMIIILAVLPL